MNDAAAGFDGRTVLVTGGAGFIGSHLTEALVERGADVTVVDDLSSGRASNLTAVASRIRLENANLQEADLGALLSKRAFDVLFHLAGRVDVPGSVANPSHDLEVNGLTAFRLLDALRTGSPGTRMVFASSAAVYGEATDRPLAEDAPTVPVAPYGVSKLMAERYVAVYAPLFDLRTASLRLFPTYGPKLRKQVVYDLIAKVQAQPEELTILGDGQQVRDFIYVSDVVEAFLLVAERAPLRGETYNVGSGQPLSIREVANAVCQQMGVRPRFVYTGEATPGVSRRWTADITQITSLGFRPQVEMSDGLAATVRWFRDEVGAG